MTLDQALSRLEELLAAERSAGPVNSLDALAARNLRRATIRTLYEQVQQQVNQVVTAIHDLPALPPDEVIQWAQSVVAMPGLRFMEIDTTGLDREDEICRFTLVDGAGRLVFDQFIRPTRELSDEASRANGIRPADLEQAPAITDVWEQIGRALHGVYILSYNQDWDLQLLRAEALRHHLPPITVIGECLYHQAMRYFCEGYRLTLAGLCERIGHPLPEPPNRTSIDRAAGQYHLLSAMAHAVTDVRPLQPERESAGDLLTGDPLGDDLDDHPF